MKAQQTTSAFNDQLTEAISRVVSSGQYVEGKEVLGFETSFAAYCEVQNAIGVANGADALFLALSAVGVGVGDEVITVSFGPVAVAEAIVQLGARPIFIDIEPDGATLDAHRLEESITPQTKAIVPVHLYGHAADMDPTMDIASEYGIAVIEEATQACGATYKGKKVGSWGDLACFDFAPGNTFSALGDAGVVVTGSGELAERVRLLSHHGSADGTDREVIGRSSRLDEIQAALLSIGLEALDEVIASQTRAAQLYRSMIGDLDEIVLTPGNDDGSHTARMFVMRTDDREYLREALASQGIRTEVRYALSIHNQKAFVDRYPCKALPISERWSRTCVSLPLDASVTHEEVERISLVLRKALAEKPLSA